MGGRMATRRVAPWQWDHGMQYMVGKDPQFQALLDTLPIWSETASERWHVGAPSANQLVKSLAQNIELSLQTRIASIVREKNGRWLLEAEDSSLSPSYDAVVSAIPAPQAIELLPGSPLSAELNRVAMVPCWALMVASPEQVELPATIESPHEFVSWFAADHTKPGRPEGYGQYVLHATEAWSERHLEDTSETAKAGLLECFQEIAGDIEISYAAAHRWRYAFTRMPLGQPCLIDPSKRIGLCGDWCLGSRVEDGYMSGVALAETLAESL